MIAKRVFLCASALMLTTYQTALAQTVTWPTGYSAAWLAQIGVSNDIENQANGGAGAVIGLVDTGVAPSQFDIAGRVSALSRCSATSFVCSNGFVDDNGHGTATAAIAAGAATSSGAGMSGVAPGATIVAEKSLNAAGSGSNSDVANGIINAVNAGAQVVNLSLTYSPTTSIVSAINYAASKGAIIVFAGGNSATVLNGGADTKGLTVDALNRLVIVGSVNSSNVISTFSNKPGTGGAVASTTRVAYSSLWLMAPGEKIAAPAIQYGSNSFGYWSGTSMSAPMVSGALALLESAWPILRTNGTATNVLFLTATDLGSAGTDTTYGTGLLNVERAFQPIGALTVTTTSGVSTGTTTTTTTTPTNQLKKTKVSRSSLGSISKVQSVLSDYTAFDAFKRNFSVDLSPLLEVVGGKSPADATLLSPAVLNSASHLANGGTLAFTMAADDIVPRGINPGASSFANAMAANTDGQATGAWVMTLNDPSGTNISVGHGFPVNASFAEALWGQDTLAVSASYSLQGLTELSSLAGGGHFMAFGANIGEGTRAGFSLSESGMADYSMPSASRMMPHSSAVTAGVATEFTSAWTGGMTMTFLGEQNGLLGAQYTSDGSLSLGNEHRTMSLGLSSALKLGSDTGLLFNAALARTQAGHADGLIAGTSALLARSYGMALVSQNLINSGDHFSLSLTKPLRVFDGSINVTTTTVDEQGYPVAGITKVSMRPDGSETDLAAGYARFWGDMNFSGSVNLRQDADNMKGVTDVVVRLGTGVRF
jgi:hypothetical protein